MDMASSGAVSIIFIGPLGLITETTERFCEFMQM